MPSRNLEARSVGNAVKWSELMLNTFGPTTLRHYIDSKDAALAQSILDNVWKEKQPDPEKPGTMIEVEQSMFANEVEDVSTLPEGAVKHVYSFPKENPDWDKSKEYVPREQRPEWATVGLLGQVWIKRGQPTAPQWRRIGKENKDAELWLVK